MGAWIAGETYPDGDRIRRLSVPEWLTDTLAAEIYRVTRRWEYAGYSDRDLHVEIPIEWVPQDQRQYYGPGAQLFGLDLRLNGYITEAQVSVKVPSQ